MDPPTSPTNLVNRSPVRPSRSGKRGYSISTIANGDSSGASEGEDEDGRKRHNPGVKRACNECRQQKLRCDVVQDPYRACTRCTKHRLECRIDSNFKRIGKRSRYVELEREKYLLERRVTELERLLFRTNTVPSVQNGTPALTNQRVSPPDTVVSAHTPILSSEHAPTMHSAIYTGIPANTNNSGSHEAVASLLDLKQGFNPVPVGTQATGNSAHQLKSLGEVVLAPDRVQELFLEFFDHYHPFLPLLNREKPPEFYFQKSLLLFWTVLIIAARHFEPDPSLLPRLTNPYTHLVWSTVSKVPQDYHVVKALCLLCTWPLPTSSTSTDPTYMFSGLMMKIAKQVGLHRPASAQDFSKTRIVLCEEDVHDMLLTWACCNIVAQNASTGFGQPPDVVYDTALEFDGLPLEDYPLPLAIAQRLELEKLCNRITLNLYTHATGTVGLWDGIDESVKVNMFGKLLDGFAKRVQSPCQWLTLHIRAVDLHLRLHTFTDSPSSVTYISDLEQLYSSTFSFLDTALEDEEALKYASNYIMQMMLAAGFALMRLLNSFLTRPMTGNDPPIEVERGRKRFYNTVHAIRNLSVTPNDLPQRLAEVLVQLWRAYGGGMNNADPDSLDLGIAAGLQEHAREFDATAAVAEPMQMIPMHNNPYQRIGIRPSPGSEINSLELRVRNRMSMSLLYDSVWRWREEIQGTIRAENLDAAVQNPTSPETNPVSFQPGAGAPTGLPDTVSPLINSLQTTPIKSGPHPVLPPHSALSVVPPSPMDRDGIAMATSTAPAALFHQTLSSVTAAAAAAASAMGSSTTTGGGTHDLAFASATAGRPDSIESGRQAGPLDRNGISTLLDISAPTPSSPNGVVLSGTTGSQRQNGAGLSQSQTYTQPQGHNQHGQHSQHHQPPAVATAQQHPLAPMFPNPMTSIDMFDPLSWFLNETAGDPLFTASSSFFQNTAGHSGSGSQTPSASGAVAARAGSNRAAAAAVDGPGSVPGAGVTPGATAAVAGAVSTTAAAPTTTPTAPTRAMAGPGQNGGNSGGSGENGANAFPIR